MQLSILLYSKWENRKTSRRNIMFYFSALHTLNSGKRFWTCNCVFILTITGCDNMHIRWTTEKIFSIYCFLGVATSICYAIWLKTCIHLCGWDAHIRAAYESVVCIIPGVSQSMHHTRGEPKYASYQGWAKVCIIPGVQPKRFLVVNSLPPKFSTWNHFRFLKYIIQTEAGRKIWSGYVGHRSETRI